MADAVAGGAIDVDVLLDPGDWAAEMADVTRRGLAESPPWVPPLWFYDDEGSVLFDEITRLPEYYPTRAEAAILAAHAGEIAERTGVDTLVELGSGTSEKTRLLLEALDLEHFVPFDCSEGVLRSAATAIAEEHPDLAVHAVVGDFHRHLPDVPRKGRRLLAFLGSTIGNLDPSQRRRFLGGVHAGLDDDEWLLLGTDLVKDPARLVAAYDDGAGVTAAFNRNALAVLNRELDADFDLDAYHHVAHWEPATSCIEMRLVADEDQHVRVPGLGVDVDIPADGWLRTEISTKFTAEGVGAELAAAGLAVEDQWTDPNGDFLVTLARPLGGADDLPASAW